MRRFEASELKRFLRAIDDQLTDSLELWVVGGSAAALGCGIPTLTRDIDTFPGRQMPDEAVVEKAQKSTGLFIPIAVAGPCEPPYNFEDRVEVVPIKGMKHLVVKVPEKHDLVLMKMMRGEEPDLAVAEEIHRLHRLDMGILIERYLNEMDAAIGRPSTRDLNFLALISRLYGEDAEKEAEGRIKAHRTGHRAEWTSK